MAERLHLLLVILMLLVISQALTKRSRNSYKERIKEKVGERGEETEEKEESSEKSEMLGWRRKRSVQYGTMLSFTLS